MKAMSKQYNVYYKDGVFSERITFINKSAEEIEMYFEKLIKEYNKNPVEDWHITRENIKPA